ncbi:MAG: NAD(P)/FAD-dependent oxidoreductase, partial [Pseudonocardiaceae bacterium]
PAPPGPQRDAAICGDPEFLRAQVDEGLRRLRVDRLQPHRLDSAAATRSDPDAVSHPSRGAAGTEAELPGEGSWRVVVVGASVAGLFAAAAAADSGNLVTVLERDALAGGPTPRAGVPQGRQPHVFLFRGLLALEELLPGSRQELLDSGAVPFDTGELPWFAERGWLPVDQPAFEVLSMTRPLFEHVVRRRAEGLPGVRIRPASKVTGLRRGDRCWEVELADGATVPADLVIDASGRSSRLPVWLAQVGVGVAPVSEVDSGVGYATRMYAAAPSEGGAVGVIIQQTPATLAGGTALPVEGGRWLVSAVGCAENRPPRDAAGFVSFLERLPDPALAQLVHHAGPLDDVAVHRQTANHRHHYERVPDWPDGLLVVGDAFCAFNPIYGQGITVAACEALLLRRVMATGLRPGYARRLLRKFATVVSLPWAIATSEDLRYPTSTGRQSIPQALLGRWTRQLGRLAIHGNRRAHAVLARVYHLMGSPALLFHPALVAAALRALLTGYGPAAPRPAALASFAGPRPPAK